MAGLYGGQGLGGTMFPQQMARTQNAMGQMGQPNGANPFQRLFGGIGARLFPGQQARTQTGLAQAPGATAPPALGQMLFPQQMLRTQNAMNQMGLGPQPFGPFAGTGAEAPAPVPPPMPVVPGPPGTMTANTSLPQDWRALMTPFAGPGNRAVNPGMGSKRRLRLRQSGRLG